MFKRSVLVTLLLTQVFIFYEKQLAGLVGFALQGLLLMALELMIRREEGEAEGAD
jgi:hypothetical protein